MYGMMLCHSQALTDDSDKEVDKSSFIFPVAMLQLTAMGQCLIQHQRVIVIRKTWTSGYTGN